MGLLLILIMAFFFGAKTGATTARKDMGRHYKTKKADSKGAEYTGLSTAAVLSTAGHSVGLAGRGFIRGWRAGWPKGRVWVEDKLARYRKAEPELEVVEPKNAPAPAAAEKPKADDLDVPDFVKPEVPAPRAGETPAPTDPAPAPEGPGLAPVHDITSMKKATIPAAGPTTEGVTMPLTTTAAEATNHSSLLAALAAIENEASANIDDASADLTRSQQEVTNIEALVAGLTELELDRESLGEIQSLIEQFQARAAAAQQRLDASEALSAKAARAAQLVTQKHQTMKEAHDATPEAAKKAYYKGD